MTQNIHVVSPGKILPWQTSPGKITHQSTHIISPHPPHPTMCGAGSTRKGRQSERRSERERERETERRERGRARTSSERSTYILLSIKYRNDDLCMYVCVMYMCGRYYNIVIMRLGRIIEVLL